MFEKNAEFLVEPVAIEYINLPDGKNDIWLRKNITKTTRTNVVIENSKDETTVFTAEEAYMRGTVEKDEIEANFDKWFEIAKEWQLQQNNDKINTEKRIEAIEQILMKNMLSV